MTLEDRPAAPRPSVLRAISAIYRVAWLTLCVALALCGATVLAIVSPLLLAVVSVAFGLVGATVGGCQGAGGRGGPGRRGAVRRALVGAVTAATAASGYVGLALVAGAGVLAATLVVAATSPPALRRYARWLRAAVTDPSTASIAAVAGWAPVVVPPAPRWSPLPLSADPVSLSNEELCHAWFATYQVLKDRSSRGDGRATLATVQQRQRLLDELERRNAAGFAAWLVLDARVARIPLPYLTESRSERPSTDWDEPT